MTKIAIFASGSGSNAERIIEESRKGNDITVAVVIYNRADAGVVARAERLGVPAVYLPKADFMNAEHTLALLRQYEVEGIVLAGFLLLVPPYLVEAYPNRIINIHPALLPKYGGKGMYGMHVHEAVVAAGEYETGITIHLVDEHYDHGTHLHQASVEVLPTDTPEDVAAKVHTLEHRDFPTVVANYFRSLAALQ